jgi:hypothetical protein
MRTKDCRWHLQEAMIVPNGFGKKWKNTTKKERMTEKYTKSKEKVRTHTHTT